MKEWKIIKFNPFSIPEKQHIEKDRNIYFKCELAQIAS